MLKMVRASALLILLVCAVNAGESPNNVTESPAPPQPVMSAPEPVNDAGLLPDTTAESFGESLLSFIDSVLALF